MDLCIWVLVIAYYCIFYFFKFYEIITKLYNFSLPFPHPKFSFVSILALFQILGLLKLITWVYVHTYILLNIACSVCAMRLVCMFSEYHCILAICIPHICWAGNLMHFSGEVSKLKMCAIPQVRQALYHWPHPSHVTAITDFHVQIATFMIKEVATSCIQIWVMGELTAYEMSLLLDLFRTHKITHTHARTHVRARVIQNYTQING